MPPCSDAKLNANRLNAQKSTGPKTQAGKDVCRTNSMKHGHCALVLDHPDVETALLNDREAAWQAELNPSGRSAQGYIVHQAVRKSARLDRLNLVYHQRSAKLSRNAVKNLQDRRKVEVEELARLIKEDPDTAVRRMKKTTDGCEWLIKEWTALLLTVLPPARFDHADQMGMIRMMGRLQAVRDDAPCPIGLETLAIHEHRKVVEALENNKTWPNYYGKDRYPDLIFRTIDEKNVGGLGELAEIARLKLKVIMDQNIQELTALKAGLEIDEAIDEANLPTEAMFDASDEGKLLHRYEMDLERSYHRCLKEIRDLDAHDIKMAQVVCDKEIIEISGPVAKADVPGSSSRNRPNPTNRERALAAFNDTLIKKNECIPLNMTAPTPPKPRL